VKSAPPNIHKDWWLWDL